MSCLGADFHEQERDLGQGLLASGQDLRVTDRRFQRQEDQRKLDSSDTVGRRLTGHKPGGERIGREQSGS
jgi:hypothetical protein